VWKISFPKDDYNYKERQELEPAATLFIVNQIHDLPNDKGASLEQATQQAVNRICLQK